MENNNESLIPFALIHSLARIENIFEMRLFGWILAKAQSVLKIISQDLGDINVQHALNLVRVTIPARLLLPSGDRNYKNIEKAFTLANKTIDYEKDGRKFHLNIIAFPEFARAQHRTEITFVIHNELWHAIINNFQNGYRLVNLATFMNLKSTYAAIMYLLVSQQTRAITMKINTLRATIGATSRAYDRTNNLLARVIEPARAELTKYAPFTFDYEMTRGGKGNGYHTIVIRPRPNDHFEPARDELTQEIDRQRSRLDEQVTDYLRYKFELTASEIDRVESYLLQLGASERQMDKLTYIAECAHRNGVRSLKGYLYTALRG